MRRYTQEEVSEILKAAAAPTIEASREKATFTLDELQKAGSELGLDPLRVADAATKVSMRPRQGQESSPWIHRFTTLHDQPISAIAWEEIVNLLRSELRIPGAVRQRADGGSEWVGTTGSETVTVSTVSENGRWRLDVSADRKHTRLIGATFGLSISTFLVMNALNTVGKSGLGSVEAMFTIALVPAAICIALFALSRSRLAGQRRFANLAQRLNEIAMTQSPIPQATQIASDTLHLTA